MPLILAVTVAVILSLVAAVLVSGRGASTVKPRVVHYHDTLVHLTSARSKPARGIIPANSTEFTLINNYGGNSNGYLTDRGHNNPLESCAPGACPNHSSVTWGWFLTTVPGVTGWYMLQSVEGLCADVGSNNVVYAESCAGTTPEQWRQYPGDFNTWQNRHTGSVLTSDALSNGATVRSAGGGARGENQWANYPAGATKTLSPARAGTAGHRGVITQGTLRTSGGRITNIKTGDPVYELIDSYGGNACCGTIIDTGHGSIALTGQQNAGYGNEHFVFYASGTSGWYDVCQYGGDGLCLDEASNSWVYMESNANTTPEQWAVIDPQGGSVYALQNRHYGNQVLTAASLNNGAQVHGAQGGLSAVNAWGLVCVSSC